jgi:hypothetical protein
MANRSGGKYGLLAALLGDLVTVVAVDRFCRGVWHLGQHERYGAARHPKGGEQGLGS